MELLWNWTFPSSLFLNLIWACFSQQKNEKENFLDQCDELAKQGPPTSQTKENLFWGSF
jgi:hypothetical protein